MEESALQTIYPALGAEGMAALVSAFYRRVAEDPLLRPMYPDEDFDGAEARLLGFLTFRFGGPRDYLEQRGHPRLRMRHAPFPVGQAARDRWVLLMQEAIEETVTSPDIASTLEEFFAATATFLINRDD